MVDLGGREDSSGLLEVLSTQYEGARKETEHVHPCRVWAQYRMSSSPITLSYLNTGRVLPGGGEFS